MSRTFEELVAERLDVLYRGALFLAGGRARDAESLLVSAMQSAYRTHEPEDLDDLEPLLEARLVDAFLGGHERGTARSPRPSPRGSAPPRAVVRIEPDALVAAAGVVPPEPRAALWLVMVQRRSYAAAAELLGVDQGTLGELLLYRDAFVGAVLSAGSSRRGAGGA